MAHRYETIGNGAAAVSPGRTLVSLIAATTRRAWIYEIIAGSADTPGDYQFQWQIIRFTADGTGTAITPRAIDPGNPAAILTSKSNYSAEPTYTANSELFDEGIAQRATFRWTAWDQFDMKVVPATASNGIGIRAIHASQVLSLRSTVAFEE